MTASRSKSPNPDSKKKSDPQSLQDHLLLPQDQDPLINKDFEGITPEEFLKATTGPSINDCAGGCGQKVTGTTLYCTICQEKLKATETAPIQPCNTCLITTKCPHSSNPTGLCLYELQLTQEKYKTKEGLEDEMREILTSLKRLRLRVERKVIEGGEEDDPGNNERNFIFYSNFLLKIIDNYSRQMQTFAKLMGWDKAMMDMKEMTLKAEVISKLIGSKNIAIDRRDVVVEEKIKKKGVKEVIVGDEAIDEGNIPHTSLVEKVEVESEKNVTDLTQLLTEKIEVEREEEEKDITIGADSQELARMMEEADASRLAMSDESEDGVEVEDDEGGMVVASTTKPDSPLAVMGDTRRSKRHGRRSRFRDDDGDE